MKLLVSFLILAAGLDGAAWAQSYQVVEKDIPSLQTDMAAGRVKQ